MFPIKEIAKPVNTHCPNCDKGCLIYDTKPQECTDFMCAYLQVDTHESLRPDKCGIIFVKKTDRIFTGSMVTGAKVTNDAKGQIQSFNDQGYSVVLLSMEEEKPFVKLAKGHEIEEIITEYKETISGDLQH